MTKVKAFNLTNDEILWGVNYIHENRSKKAREVDEGETARVTENPFLWMENPNRYDFPYIDTIVRQEPRGYTKERGRRAAVELKGFFNL